jgi:hypothetical protein
MLDIARWKIHSGSIVAAVWRSIRAFITRKRCKGLTACIATFSGRCT